MKKSINLTGKNMHGKVYTDNYFKGLSLNPLGTELMYTAEKKRPNSSGFFQNGSNSGTIPGQQFNYVDDWGEQMTNKSESVIAILNLESESLQILDLPDGQYCYGNAIWINDTEIIGTATLIEGEYVDNNHQ